MFGIREKEASSARQSEFDTELVKKVLSAHNVECDNIKPIRRGTYDSANRDLKRPIKVKLSGHESVENVLKNSAKLKTIPEFNVISVSYDKTPMQSAYYKEVKDELRRRMEGGENNIKIWHVRGIPSIVSGNDRPRQGTV